MLRSTAKNNDFVTVVADPADYMVVSLMRCVSMTVQLQGFLASSRALKVFKTTAAYDGTCHLLVLAAL